MQPSHVLFWYYTWLIENVARNFLAYQNCIKAAHEASKNRFNAENAARLGFADGEN